MTAIPLVGQFIKLEPLAESHRAGLYTAAQDLRIWEFNIVTAFGPAFDVWFANALKSVNRWAFAVVSGDRIVGSSSFIDLLPEHRRTEIGHTWFHPDVWRTAVNVEAKQLMLADAIDRLGFTRVSFNVDAINLRSRKAVEKLGAVQEGILRRHAITYTGRVRDTVVYSILADEWPMAREKLGHRIQSFSPSAFIGQFND